MRLCFLCLKASLVCIPMTSIILMLHSPRYSVNIKFQGATAKLTNFFSFVFCQVSSVFFLLFDVHISKLY